MSVFWSICSLLLAYLYYVVGQESALFAFPLLLGRVVSLDAKILYSLSTPSDRVQVLTIGPIQAVAGFELLYKR